MGTDATHELHAAYQEADRATRVKYLQVSCLLVMGLTLSGVTLDQTVYPDLAGKLFAIRLTCVLLTALLIPLCRTDFGRQHIAAVGIAWSAICQWSICAMVYISEGAMSPYYAGLNLVILGVAVFLPFTFKETVTICALTMGGYLLACLLHRETALNWVMMVNNTSFLLFTATICATSSYFTSRARREEFRLRHELNERNQQLAELDRMKTEFFSNISHEFRTPLTLIVAPIDQLLQQRDLPNAVQESLVLIQKNALRLLKLITDLLELARLEDSKSQVQVQQINLGLAVPGIVDSVRHLAMAKSLKMYAEGDERLEIRADQGHLEKVLLNILTNAIKFTPAGGSVTSKWMRRDGRAIIEITDTGIGIPEAELPFIFNRFRQVDGSSTRKYQGMGIGLALVKDLVEKHGGTASATSVAGKGTTFLIDFPAADAVTPAVAPAKTEVKGDVDPIVDIYNRADRTLSGATQNTAIIPETGSGDFRILVVDDEPDMRKFLVATLSTEYRVLQAIDGLAGLETTRQQKPDLLLLDLMLPGMDGLSVCRAIKSDATLRHIRVVLLTARGDEQSRIQALQSGADDFLTKPFSTLEVRTRIANLLRSALLERDLRLKNIELEAAMAKLKEAEAHLVQSEKMSALGTMSAGLLHEINNPLNFMFTALHVAEQSVEPQQADLKDTLHDIGDGMKRIKDIISDLRAFAYPTREMQSEVFPIGELIDTAVRLTAAETKHVKIIKNVDEAMTVTGSKSHLVQVLVNLILNSSFAVKAAGRPGEISISVVQKNGHAIVSVRDNGTGIPAAIRSRVSEPFFTTKPVGEGMGLGLSICHTIIRNHGGNLNIHSEEGQWTEISFELQSAMAEEAA